MEEGKVSSGDIQLHYIAEGPADGEPVLLLHGFPQFSYEWRHQLKALSEAGYRAVAPDLRGYNLSDRPEGVENYTMDKLVGDVVAIYKAFGWSQANVVAHDWGGAIAWPFVIRFPQLVKKFVALDIPHPLAFREAQHTDIRQLQASWYIWFFQAPDVPEQFFSNNMDLFMNWIFQVPGNRQVFSPEDLAQYREMLSQPGQFTAAMNYYRANISQARVFGGAAPKLPPVETPTLLVYGKKDLAFSPKVWEGTAQYCTGPFKLVGLDGVGHWTPEEATEDVNRLILEHLQS